MNKTSLKLLWKRTLICLGLPILWYIALLFCAVVFYEYLIKTEIISVFQKTLSSTNIVDWLLFPLLPIFVLMVLTIIGALIYFASFFTGEITKNWNE